ncbi:hypothetical protein [Caulobacter segnis]|uniref:hypothetical protein n=1 Tax=Caulobacter segnis TaxID=88688 RepID=UPI0026F03DE3|nr:hypothetical protein [Caulobacter segnis]
MTLDVKAPAEISRPLRVGMLSDAWTVVDAIHASRLLLGALGSDQVKVLAAEYLDLTKPAWSMRNDMDHLPQKLGNFARRRGVVQPLYGSVRYVRATGQGQYTIITLPFASAVEEWAALILTPETIVSEGVTSIHLEAFGHDFALQPACENLRHLLEQIAAVIEPMLIDGLTKASGGDPEELAKALTPLGMDLVMSLSFQPHAEDVAGVPQITAS